MKAVGPNVVTGAVGLVPHRDGIATAINRDLRIKGSSCVVGLNQFGSAPAGAIKAVGHNVVIGTVVLEPHRDRIAAVINRSLRVKGISCVVGLNQFVSAPAPPDVVKDQL